MAKDNIATSKELISLINQDIVRGVSAITIGIEEKLTELTQHAIYDNKPRLYKRTYDFIRSITRNLDIQDGYFCGSVYFDANKMRTAIGTFRRGKVQLTYGKHANNKGKDVRHKLVMYLEDGHDSSRPYAYTVNRKRKGLHMYPHFDGGHMIRDTIKWADENIPLYLAKVFSGRIDNAIIFRK